MSLFRMGTRAYYYDGLLDETRVSNTARTPDEIRQAYEIGKRTHTITNDFVTTPQASYSSGTSVTINNPSGTTNLTDTLNIGDTMIFKENVGGTETVSQSTVTGVTNTSSTYGTVTLLAAPTFPSGGYTTKATVFKWQREYFDLTGIMSTQRDAITRLTLRATDGSQGSTVWLDDFRSGGPYLTTPTGSTVTSTLNRYLQYQSISSTTDTAVTPSLSAVTVNYTPMSPPTHSTPTALSTTSLRWNFTDNTSVETGFKIYNGSNSLVITCATADISSCDETGLSVNTQYTRKVAAYTGIGNSSYSSTQAVYTLANAPSTPTVTTVSGTTQNVVIVTNSNPTATEFSIQETGSSNYVNKSTGALGSISWGTYAEFGSGSGITVTGLSAGTNYTFQVKARNG
ncbi:MAG: hypothetical protein AAB914_01020, partial [Patescibacteria group bacterium]